VAVTEAANTYKLLCAFSDRALSRNSKQDTPRSNTYLYTVVALLVNDGNVAPVHRQYNVDHHFDLIVIAGYSASEIFEALFVGKLGARREKGDLQRTIGRFPS